MELRHLSLNNTIIHNRQLITSTIDVDTYIETTLYRLLQYHSFSYSRPYNETHFTSYYIDEKPC